MKLILHLILFFYPFILVSQSDYVEDVLPTPGDVIEYVADEDFKDVDFKGNIRGKTEWDFTNLDYSHGETTVKVLSIDKSKNKDRYPESDLIIKEDEESEEFYEIQDVDGKYITKKIMQNGVIGKSYYSYGLPVDVKLKGNSLYIVSGIKVGDNIRHEYKFTTINPSSAFVDIGVTNLASFGIDSVKILSTIKQDFEVDAYGKMKLPKAEYDVVRIRQTSDIYTTLELKYATGGWIKTNPDIFGEEIGSIFGNRQLTQYTFYSEGYHLPIVNVFLTDVKFGGFNDRVFFLKEAAPEKTSTKDIVSEDSFKVYPNPTMGDVTFERSGSRGKLKVSIYNIIGKKIEEYQFKAGQNKMNVNLSHLQKGTYIYSIIDQYGYKLLTKRLLVLNP